MTRFVYNNTRHAPVGAESQYLSFWGVACSIMRQDGSTTLRRLSSAAQGKGNWQVLHTQYGRTPMMKDATILMLSQTQFFQVFRGTGPDTTTPGIGGRLNPGTFRGVLDINDFVSAFLYMEGEARTAVYEVLQPTTKEKNDSLVYDVQAEGGWQQLYSLTFIPWILLTAAFALFGACLLALALGVDSMKLRSFKAGRTVDVLRLIMDMGATLEKETFEDSLLWETEKLDQWAEKVYIRLK
ncbi:hypothetical protein F4677DRAFT_461934 [Hypoxylon crocopeplum]|nr:hypothetical protein F4677DRAFT_461934 [Hypoxylon crocopeplum]